MKKTKEQFIKEANEIHNNKYDYSKVEYQYLTDTIEVICKEHGAFKQRARKHLEGNGCSNCNKDNRKKTKEQFIKEANEIHNNKYDYSKVEYVNNITNVIIICPIHGELKQLPINHINKKRGCKFCGLESSSKIRRKPREQFIKEAIEIHGDKYDYSKIEYINNKKEIEITCKEHGTFKQSPSNHLKFFGCPVCSSSIGEEIIFKTLKEKNLKYVREFKFENCRNIYMLPFDFAIFDYNEKLVCLIEYDGIQHFESIEFFGGEKSFQERKRLDEIKNNYCRKNNIKLYRISYLQNIDEELEKILNV